MPSEIKVDSFDIRPVAIDLAYEALEGIENDYGPNSPDPRPYHNVYHAKRVARDTNLITRRSNISPHNRELLIISAFFHDRVNTNTCGPDEAASADAAHEAMNQKGAAYTLRDHNLVDSFIHGTVWHNYRGRIVQHANSHLSKILADGDLSAIGLPPHESWLETVNLFREYNPGKQVTFEDMQDFITNKAIPAVEKHRYHTRAASEIFRFRVKNLNFLKQILDTEIIPLPKSLAA